MASVSISYSTTDRENPGNERILGKEIIENIDEVLVPLSKKTIPMFITKAFSGEECRRWRVEDVRKINENQWTVWLKNQINEGEVYLSSTMTRRSIHNAYGIVKKGTIVIVEFGHIHQTLNFQTGPTDNATYYCNHLSGEMHKRRPAIVVSADKRGVKVVPVTSQEPEGFTKNKSIFELESQSTRQISEFNTGKNSYVLCEMIQTVSPARILPPLALDQRSNDRTYRRDESYHRKLSTNDMAALQDGLLSAVGMSSLKKKIDSLVADIDQVNLVCDTATLQLKAQAATEEQLRSQLQLLQSKYEILANFYLLGSEHTSLADVEKEVIEYLS
ncbi:type II toxin-antitoxin system PemK/MazF family toxin [Cronobacter turicensis]|nr:type II toxin-antitoxin system PemK/MazF family toxin [Cronobacter turicensis]ELY6156750.1 type II toxin-antitoxin system PemK/MazF family toxin [Cronobacter sakazakii]EKM0439082.1 type II toxin-antitoxin system PemK/MazF family toxin [Cronobacter turicensis]ELY4323726.1 type II toxin-antitoxin system PemK/MazF family toxin [Cronobacter turicensis]ELY5945269.1 type II toxin-antitoxin system PemK/MazF family toxin [Cronobacter turicensis]